MASTQLERIGLFLASCATRALGQSALGLRGVTIDDNGDYVLVDQRAKAVFRVTPEGRVSTVFQGEPLCAPADLVLLPR